MNLERRDHALKLVSDLLGVKPKAVLGGRRRRQLCHARHLTMRYLYETTDMTLQDIAHLMGKKCHSTVLNGIANAKAPELDRLYKQITLSESLQMDPEASWMNFVYVLNMQKFEAARIILTDLAQWCARGGFPPRALRTPEAVRGLHDLITQPVDDREDAPLPDPVPIGKGVKDVDTRWEALCVSLARFHKGEVSDLEPRRRLNDMAQHCGRMGLPPAAAPYVQVPTALLMLVERLETNPHFKRKQD